MDAEEPSITLLSREGHSFTVPLTVAKLSALVKSIVDEEDDDDDDNNNATNGAVEIPLPNVNTQLLQKVLQFCEHHLKEPMTAIEKPLKSKNMSDVVQKWYADFVDANQFWLYELIMAANYMDIQPLLDLTCATAATTTM